jgi:hypothetical protein
MKRLRTIRRVSLELNRDKWGALCELTRRYKDEKNIHLLYYHEDAQLAAESSERFRRDELVAATTSIPTVCKSACGRWRCLSAEFVPYAEV